MYVSSHIYKFLQARLVRKMLGNAIPRLIIENRHGILEFYKEGKKREYQEI
jgi:hypothetical protein